MHWAISPGHNDLSKDLSKDFLLILPVCPTKPQAIYKLNEAPSLIYTQIWSSYNSPSVELGILEASFRDPNTVTISSNLIGVSCERPQSQMYQLIQGSSDRFIYRQEADFIPNTMKTEDYLLHRTVSYWDSKKPKIITKQVLVERLGILNVKDPWLAVWVN